MAEAAQQLEQAVKLDPKYARAYSRLSAIYLVLPTYTGTETPGVSPQLVAAARRAIELDPKLAEPWAVLGLASSQGDQDELGGRDNFEKALQIDPDDVTTNFWYGLTLLRSGYRKAGLERVEHALAIDPMLPNALRWRGVVYLRDGDIDGAEQFLKRAQGAGLKIAGRELAEIAGQRGQVEDARRLLKAGTETFFPRLPPGSPDIIANGMYGGTAEERARAIALLESYAAERKAVSGLLPLMLLQMGDGAKALEIAREKVPGDDSDLLVYLFSPVGAKARTLPEFQAFVKQRRLEEAWAKYGPPDLAK